MKLLYLSQMVYIPDMQGWINIRKKACDHVIDAFCFIFY